MKKVGSILILFLALFSFILLSTDTTYASDDPAYDAAWTVYLTQGPEASIPSMRQCAERGNITAIWMLGWMYTYTLKDANINYSEALAWFNKYLNHPNANKPYGYYEIGLLYWHGGHGLDR